MARKTIYVTGHKNPDSDAIISAMAYAYLKQQQGYDAIAVRAGAINPETEYILNLFNEFAPPLASDIKTRVRDIDFDDVTLIKPDLKFKEVLNLMSENDVKVAVIADNHRHLLGVITVSDITEVLVVDRARKEAMLSQTELKAIAEVLDGRIVADHGNSSNGEVYVASIRYTHYENKIVVVSDATNKQKEAITHGAKILVICGEDCDQEVIDTANEYGCSIILSSLNLYETVKEIDLAIPVSLVMTENVITFSYDDYMDDVKIKINKSRFRSYPVLDRHQHVIGMISRFHMFQHANRNLIMVDHNEITQSIDGADQANIIEIIDHHRIGGIKTASPVFFRNEQTGSCSTIITEMFDEKDIEIPPDLAGMLCCAIISDTVNFHSVTCTQKDIDTAERLAKIAGMDVKELGPQILRSGAKLENKSVDAILHHDFKRFEIGKLKVAVGQTNIVNFEAIVTLKEKMNEHLHSFAANNGLNICMMVFSLIDGTGSYVLVQGEDRKLVEYAFEDISVNVDGYMFLPQVMSRKLQIIPKITEAAEGK